jgi:LysM repeat protein
VVQEGDTLAGIANAFGTSVSVLQAANDLEDTDVILIGQELLIP